MAASETMIVRNLNTSDKPPHLKLEGKKKEKEGITISHRKKGDVDLHLQEIAVKWKSEVTHHFIFLGKILHEQWEGMEMVST